MLPATAKYEIRERGITRGGAGASGRRLLFDRRARRSRTILPDTKTLPGDLRKTAALKRNSKKELKTSRVDAAPTAGSLARDVYSFPRSIPMKRQVQAKLQF